MADFRQGLESFQKQLDMLDDDVFDYSMKSSGFEDALAEKSDTVLRHFLRKDFEWTERPDEKYLALKIEERAKEFIREQFEDVDQILSNFYESIRVVETVEDGSPVYLKTPSGEYVEDWRQLTGQDADTAIFSLQRVIDRLQGEISRLYFRAQFSYYTWDEEFWEAYRAPVAGTQYDRIASARVKTRESRFFYFAQYQYWKQVYDKLQLVKETQKKIEDAVSRRLYDRRSLYSE